MNLWIFEKLIQMNFFWEKLLFFLHNFESIFSYRFRLFFKIVFKQLKKFPVRTLRHTPSRRIGPRTKIQYPETNIKCGHFTFDRHCQTPRNFPLTSMLRLRTFLLEGIPPFPSRDRLVVAGRGGQTTQPNRSICGRGAARATLFLCFMSLCFRG